MKIFILRHGMTAASDTDEDRELSAKGIKEIEDVVNLRRDDLQKVSRIYSSPLHRVRQTLEIAAKLLEYPEHVVESENLKTGSRLNEIIAFVNELEFDGGDILVSSHQSCTSILVLWLTGVDILIPNGSLLAIDIGQPAQGAGKILWQESRDGNALKRATSFVDQF